MVVDMEGPVAEQDTVEVVTEATQEAVKVCSCIYEQLEVKNLASLILHL